MEVKTDISHEGYRGHRQGCSKENWFCSLGCQTGKGMNNVGAWEKQLINSHMLQLDRVQGGIILSAFAEEYCENEWDIISKTIRDVWTKAIVRKIQVFHY